MVMNTNTPIPLLSKEYWKRILPDDGSISYVQFDSSSPSTYRDDDASFVGVKQSDFLREFSVSGHKIMSKIHHPDIVKYDDEKKVYITEKISRVGFSFQEIILTKQVTALTGNPTRFRVPNASQDKQNQMTFAEWKEGWAVKDMDILMRNSCESIGKTGDVAVFMYLNDGKLKHSIFSYDKGDVLYPQYDEFGKLIVFARKYTGYGRDGYQVTKLDVYTTKEIIYFEQDLSGGNVSNMNIDGYSLDGFVRLDHTTHGYIEDGKPAVPIAYYRDEGGAWWTPSQQSIEEFEWAFSMLTHSNSAFAFPIMVIQGDGVELTNDLIRNTVKAIIMPDESSSAKYLAPEDSSNSFELQLRKLFEMIFLQSFAVNPPEVRSGDLPGVAIKLLYSPSIEKAQATTKKLNPFLDQIVNMFTHLYGLEKTKTSQFKALNISAWLEPYVHQNDGEIMKNLEIGVNAGYVSKKTATEVSPYSNNNEMERLKEEEESINEQDLLTDVKRPMPR